VKQISILRVLKFFIFTLYLSLFFSILDTYV